MWRFFLLAIEYPTSLVAATSYAGFYTLLYSSAFGGLLVRCIKQFIRSNGWNQAALMVEEVATATLFNSR